MQVCLLAGRCRRNPRHASVHQGLAQPRSRSPAQFVLREIPRDRKCRSDSPLRCVDRCAAAARADAARLILLADLRRFRPSGGLGVHVRRGIQPADHRRHAGRDGEAGSRI